MTANRKDRKHGRCKTIHLYPQDELDNCCGLYLVVSLQPRVNNGAVKLVARGVGLERSWPREAQTIKLTAHVVRAPPPKAAVLHRGTEQIILDTAAPQPLL